MKASRPRHQSHLVLKAKGLQAAARKDPFLIRVAVPTTDPQIATVESQSRRKTSPACVRSPPPVSCSFNVIEIAACFISTSDTHSLGEHIPTGPRQQLGKNGIQDAGGKRMIQGRGSCWGTGVLPRLPHMPAVCPGALAGAFRLAPSPDQCRPDGPH